MYVKFLIVYTIINNLTHIHFLLATQAYDELVDIIHHPQFKCKDVVSNCRQFRKYRQRLPLLPIKSHQIHISNKKTPSTSKNIGEAYYLSISDIICYILNNPLLFNTMYFGSGQEVVKNQELGMEIFGRNHHDLDKHQLQLH